MRAEKVVYTLLCGSPVVTALVANRVYPGRVPQNSAMPVISYQLVSSVEVLPINAAAGGTLLRSRVQVTVMARTYTEVKAVHEAVRQALLFQSGLIAGVRVNGITRDLIGPDDIDLELGLYMQPVDYMLVHDET